MNDKPMFMIKSRKTGLFSKGGQDADTWTKAGKVWKRKGDLSSHFTSLSSKGKRSYRDHDAEVIEFEIVTVGTPESTDLWIEAAVVRAGEREGASQERIAKYRRERELAEYERLKKQFGDTK